MCKYIIICGGASGDFTELRCEVLDRKPTELDIREFMDNVSYGGDSCDLEDIEVFKLGRQLKVSSVIKIEEE